MAELIFALLSLAALFALAMNRAPLWAWAAAIAVFTLTLSNSICIPINSFSLLASNIFIFAPALLSAASASITPTFALITSVVWFSFPFTGARVMTFLSIAWSFSVIPFKANNVLFLA